jgi:hypothetical protein
MTNRANQEWPADTVTELDVAETSVLTLSHAITYLQNQRERGAAMQILYTALDSL